MDNKLLDKIDLLNKTTLASLVEKDSKTAIKNFTEVGIKILGADFGFAWWRFHEHDDYRLAYKSFSAPYKPTVLNLANSIIHVAEEPFFEEQLKKGNYVNNISLYLKSYIVIPAYNGFGHGSIVLCYKKEHFFSKDEINISKTLSVAVAQIMTINDLAKKEEEYKKSSEIHKAYFQALVENSHEVIMLISRKGEILYVSPSIKKIYEIEPRDIVGRNIADFVYDKDPVALSEYLEKITRFHHNTYAAEFLYKHKDDSLHSLEAASTNMLSNPTIGGIVLNIRDVTLRKRTEALKETERLLEEEKIKTEFIANATHEIRTPLAIIRGNADLAILKGSSANKKFFEDRFKAVNHEIEHLSYMLSDLSLLVSDREKIKDRLVLKETDLSKVIRHSAKTFKVIAKKKNISIKIKNNPKIILMGDDKYLEKMLANLIKNAITYGKNGGWVLINSVKKEKIVEIKVSDNGIGIGEENLPHIFSRFYKVDTSHGLSSKRFGLGLAIVKWIVSAHKGTINIESQLGKGSTFVIFLPTLN